tara:strand:- start:2505 stop:3299 length:795 start_codon:yes stop_codon:yes gene_type:complete
MTTNNKVGKKQGFFKKNLGKVVGFVKKVGKKVIDFAEKTQNATDTNVMSDDSKLHAHLANQSYTKMGQREQSLGGYDLDASFSDKKHAVYHNKKLGKTVISYRGTDPTDAEDMYNDAHIIKGTQASTNRYKRSEELYDNVNKKYGNSITSVGHSLGGNISEHIARTKGGKAETFNTGRGLDKDYAKASVRCKLPSPPKYCSSVKRHHIVGDGLSMANKGYGEGSSYKTAGLLGSHSLENFLGKSNPISKFKQQNTQRMTVGSMG